MVLKLGKFQINVSNGNVVITLQRTNPTVELTKIEAIKLRNWLNDYING